MTASTLAPPRATAPAPRTVPVAASAVGPDVTVLERIFEDAIAVAAWRRAADPAQQAALSAALPRRELVVLERVRPADLERVLGAFPAGDGREALATLLRELVELYSILAEADRIGVRLAITRGRPCPRFHVDRVGLRLICTLLGPGTEWLDGADVDRRRLGAGSRGEPDETSGLIRADATVHRLAAFDVGVFKGDAWPGNDGRGAVHRSPAPDGDWRLMLTLDAV